MPDFYGESSEFKKRFHADFGTAMHEVYSTTGDNYFRWYQGEESNYLVVRVHGQEILLDREEAGLLKELVDEFLQYT